MTLPRRLLLLILSLFFTATTYADATYGVSIATPIISSEPDTVRGLQVLLQYNPDRFHWRKFNIYFDGGATFFKAPHAAANKSIFILSASPVIRYTFNQYSFFRPYLEISIGASYLNHTRFDTRNLGEHFSFQDRFGIGTYLGADNRFSIGVNSIHYSNAHMSEHNSGITVPVMLNVNYAFL